ncbi:uncharacterized protein LOC130811088 isoform X2 [Amaranthus tricolor]|uniref:uncharacterized protein LOC130811088 isoform X2 n=1 Tax=Amaranthus tricolor TaxID=29722 RepID=UPI002586E885|nr:uncharacterized protein LOC130811088 isoform X2 [Amaranthus tricolor]
MQTMHERNTKKYKSRSYFLSLFLQLLCPYLNLAPELITIIDLPTNNNTISGKFRRNMAKIESSDIENRLPCDGDDVNGDYDDHNQKKIDVDCDDVLKFMDSLDSYLLLVNSVSSILRQGWFDFASARYSMGASRVNSVLLDLKEHSAVTNLDVTKGDEPHFTLCKWVADDAEDSKNLKEGNDGLYQKANSMRQRHKDISQLTEVDESSSPTGASISENDKVQKGRSKSLAVFGTLVSPKLRAAQLSFETALEKLIEIANMRASMLYAFEKIQEHIDGNDDHC